MLFAVGLSHKTAPIEIRERIGYMPESDAHIPGMNAVSFVAYCGQLSGLPPTDAMQRAHEVLYYVGLGEARYRNLETYSTGMKQRIKLAQALVHDPDLLLLDEPTNGMDPAGRDEMLRLVRDLAVTHGVNVIVSSHVLPDIEATCSSVIVVNGGRVAAQGQGQPPAQGQPAVPVTPFDTFFAPCATKKRPNTTRSTNRARSIWVVPVSVMRPRYAVRRAGSVSRPSPADRWGRTG